MEALLVVIYILLALSAIVIIVSVLMQQGNTANLGAISGGAETFFGKNKAKGYEAKLALMTKICAAVFIVLAIVGTAINARLSKNTATPSTAAPVTEVAATVAPETEGETVPETEAVPETVPEATAEPAPAE